MRGTRASPAEISVFGEQSSSMVGTGTCATASTVLAPLLANCWRSEPTSQRAGRRNKPAGVRFRQFQRKSGMRDSRIKEKHMEQPSSSGKCPPHLWPNADVLMPAPFCRGNPAVSQLGIAHQAVDLLSIRRRYDVEDNHFVCRRLNEYRDEVSLTGKRGRKL